MTTVAESLERGNELTGSESPRLDVEVLLSHVLNVDRSWLYTWPNKKLSHEQQQQFNALFERRLAGEPVAYIVGKWGFWSLSLYVNSSTLIPRPDTESLVERVLQLPLPNNTRVLDLGTGTGAIALALASEKPLWNITATDVSGPVVALAVKNTESLGITNVEVVQSDWFSYFEEHEFEPYDVIISNPPYIDENDEHLQQGDVRFEPRSALVSGEGGTEDIERIVFAAPKYLKPGGWLLIEHGFRQAKIVSQIMDSAGFTSVVIGQDLAGNDRLTIGQKN